MSTLDGQEHRYTVEAFCARLTGSHIDSAWAVGKTKVLLHAHCQEMLEEARKKKINLSIAKVQGRKHVKKSKNHLQVLLKAHDQLKRAMATSDVCTLDAALKNADSVGLDNFTLVEARTQLTRLWLEQGLQERLTDLLADVDNFSVVDASVLVKECEDQGFEHPLLNRLKMTLAQETVRAKLRAAILSGEEATLAAAIFMAFQTGLADATDLDKGKGDAVLVAAHRLRKRLQTQHEVEAQLKTALEQRTRVGITAALKAAQNIDLPEEGAVLGEVMALSVSLEASAAALEVATTTRSLEVLTAAVASEVQLGQAMDPRTMAAQSLLVQFQGLEKRLVAALGSSDFEQVVVAVEEATSAQLCCAALEKARTFCRNHVEHKLQTALDRAQVAGVDWKSMLGDASRMAQAIGMASEPLALEVVRMGRQLKVVQAARDAFEVRNLPALEVALANVEALGVHHTHATTLTQTTHTWDARAHHINRWTHHIGECRVHFGARSGHGVDRQSGGHTAHPAGPHRGTRSRCY
jgi:hypothetical protein